MDSTRRMGRWALVAGLAALGWLVPSCQDGSREPAGVGTERLSATAGPEAPAATDPGQPASLEGKVQVDPGVRFPVRQIELPATGDGVEPMVLLTVAPNRELGCVCPAEDCRCKPLHKGGYSCANVEGESCACTCAGGPVLTPEEIMNGGRGGAAVHGGEAVLVPGGVGEEGESR